MGYFSLLILTSLIYLSCGLRITSRNNSRLVERLGKYDREMKDGLSLLLPGIERVVSNADLRERVFDIRQQSCITKDNVVLSMDAVVYWRIFNHENSYYEISEVGYALEELVLTRIRSEIGQLDFDNTFSQRPEINLRLLDQIKEATDTWGIQVIRIELRDLIPNEGIRLAMEEQMTAEREKRAAILRSEGEKETIINEAMANSEARKIEAQAIKEATILEAEGEAKKQVELANAKSEATLLLAKAIEKNKNSDEALRVILAKEWMKMGEELAHSNGGSVLMVDPQSPASLIAALKDFQKGPDKNN